MPAWSAVCSSVSKESYVQPTNTVQHVANAADHSHTCVQHTHQPDSVACTGCQLLLRIPVRHCHARRRAPLPRPSPACTRCLQGCTVVSSVFSMIAQQMATRHDPFETLFHLAKELVAEPGMRCMADCIPQNEPHCPLAVITQVRRCSRLPAVLSGSAARAQNMAVTCSSGMQADTSGFAMSCLRSFPPTLGRCAICEACCRRLAALCG